MGGNKILIGVIVLLILIVGGVSFALLKEKAKDAKEEIKESVDKMVTKEDLKNMSDDLQSKVASLEAKLGEINSQSQNVTTQSSTQSANNSTTQTNSSATNSTVESEPQVTTESDVEEEYLQELNEDIEDMEALYAETLDVVEDVNSSINELTEAVNDIADNGEQIVEDMDALVSMAESASAQAVEFSEQAKTTAEKYKQSVEANKEMLLARKELYQANLSGDASKISSASDSFSKILQKNSTKATDGFSKEYFSQMPSYFGDVKDISGLLSGFQSKGTSLNFSKVNFGAKSSGLNIKDQKIPNLPNIKR